jgi:hypothetical protein
VIIAAGLVTGNSVKARTTSVCADIKCTWSPTIQSGALPSTPRKKACDAVRLLHSKNASRTARAQALGFTLEEIRQLLRFRENPARCSKSIRKLAQGKRDSLSAQRQGIEHMQRELSLLLNLCSGTSDHCPILERLESG